MFVQGPTSFLVLRFLLGAAEAGFYPGMILYLTYWFPHGLPRPGLRRCSLSAIPVSRRDRRARLGLDPAARRAPGPHGLAVAVPARGRADHPVRLRLPRADPGSAQGCGLAGARGPDRPAGGDRRGAARRGGHARDQPAQGLRRPAADRPVVRSTSPTPGPISASRSSSRRSSRAPACRTCRPA